MSHLWIKRWVFNGECCNIEWCCSAPSVPHSMTLDSCPVIEGNICVVQSKVSLYSVLGCLLFENFLLFSDSWVL